MTNTKCIFKLVESQFSPGMCWANTSVSAVFTKFVLPTLKFISQLVHQFFYSLHTLNPAVEESDTNIILGSILSINIDWRENIYQTVVSAAYMHTVIMYSVLVTSLLYSEFAKLAQFLFIVSWV